jgi:CheY-like chemotaxis protein
MKILVVDDDPSIRMLYKEELEDEGYEVIAASSGEEALRLFDEENPDLVTLDILMPDMDGIQVLRKMKDVGGVSDGDWDFAVWASEAYVVKSSDTRELKDTIKGLLEK